MCFNQAGNISTLDRTSLKLVDKFTYLGSNVSSTEKDIDTWLTKARTAIDKLSIIWKSDLTNKMKHSFFQAAVVSILLYGCTTWTLTKRLEKKQDSNYTRMLQAILNKSWRQHPTKHQLYGHLPPITKTIQVRRTRHAGHCWRSRDELISDVLLWTPTYGQAKAGRPARTYIQQLCEDMGCSPEDLPEAMNDREKWRERVRDTRASRATWWWWWWWWWNMHAKLVVLHQTFYLSLVCEPDPQNSAFIQVGKFPLCILKKYVLQGVKNTLWTFLWHSFMLVIGPLARVPQSYKNICFYNKIYFYKGTNLVTA